MTSLITKKGRDSSSLGKRVTFNDQTNLSQATEENESSFPILEFVIASKNHNLRGAGIINARVNAVVLSNNLYQDESEQNKKVAENIDTNCRDQMKWNRKLSMCCLGFSADSLQDVGDRSSLQDVPDSSKSNLNTKDSSSIRLPSLLFLKRRFSSKIRLTGTVAEALKKEKIDLNYGDNAPPPCPRKRGAEHLG